MALVCAARRFASVCLAALLFLSGCTMLAEPDEVLPTSLPKDGSGTISFDYGEQIDFIVGDVWNLTGGFDGSVPTKTIISLRIDGGVVDSTVADSSGHWSLTTTIPDLVGLHHFSIIAVPAHGNSSSYDSNFTVIIPIYSPPVLLMPVNYTVSVGGLLQISGSVEHAVLMTCNAIWLPDVGSERPVSIDDESGIFRLNLLAPDASYYGNFSVTCEGYTSTSTSQMVYIELIGQDALDSDTDGILDSKDNCPNSLIQFTSTSLNDHDSDGCQDDYEDDDDDADGHSDYDDRCARGVIGWNASDVTIDLDADGCRDIDEDSDDDGDGIADSVDGCPTGAVFTSSAIGDHDGDGCRDTDEDLDDDSDSILDVDDSCRIGSLNWGPSTNFNDFDRDGCLDADEDLDDDADAVLDVDDYCNQTVLGRTVNEFGCSQYQWDSDNDGIFDFWDECQGTPAGLIVNSVGCADIDGDGIFANVDDCPDSESRWTANLTGCTVLQQPVAWSSGPYGTEPYSTAGTWTIQTDIGNIVFSEHWDGKHTYQFIFLQKSNSYSNGVWTQSIGDLLEAMPDDVHLFFGSYDSDWSSDMSAMDSRIQSWLQGQTTDTQTSLQGRIHLIQERAFDTSGSLDQVISEWSSFHYGIDRFQRWRQIGSLHDWSSGTSCCTKGSFLANEPQMWAAEFAVEVRPLDEAVTVVEVWGGEQHPGGWGGGYSSGNTGLLPNASEMMQYNTLEVYLEHACPERRDRYGIDDDSDGTVDRYGGCHEWDYLHYLKICDIDDNTSCGTEFVRYITTYGREGRWLTDASPLLWMLQDGGERRFVYQGANKGLMTVKLLLSNWDDDGLRSVKGELAFTGGRFNDQYNNGSQYGRSFELNVSQQWDKVQIAASITGHGFGEVAENCAEFCNHEHRWSLNGWDVTEDHPEAGNSSRSSDRMGCQKMVDSGVVANQRGSWPYGRAGWCPGLDVELFLFDITNWIDWNGSNTMEYSGLYDGSNYTQTSTNPNIVAVIWIIYYTNNSSSDGGSIGPQSIVARQPQENSDSVESIPDNGHTAKQIAVEKRGKLIAEQRRRNS